MVKFCTGALHEVGAAVNDIEAGIESVSTHTDFCFFFSVINLV